MSRFTSVRARCSWCGKEVVLTGNPDPFRGHGYGVCAPAVILGGQQSGKSSGYKGKKIVELLAEAQKQINAPRCPACGQPAWDRDTQRCDHCGKTATEIAKEEAARACDCGGPPGHVPGGIHCRRP